MSQKTVMKFDPHSAMTLEVPRLAEPFRVLYGTLPWRFNPWTGAPRLNVDISQDPLGELIVPPGEEVSAHSPLDVQVGGDHYKKLKIQPIEYIHANNIQFAEGSIIKYVTRWRDKNGIKDLEKAKHFIELLIELESK